MSQLNIPLDIESLEILSQTVDKQGNILLEVKSKKTFTPCHKCGKPATKPYGHGPVLTVKHLSIFDKQVTLKIKPVRYQCEECDDHPTTCEQYDWCERRAKITRGLEKYLMRSLINSTVQDVSKKYNIGYKTLSYSLNRQIDKQVYWNDYDDLDTIGIDEISLKKGHQDYVTIISTRSKSGTLSVISVLPGRLKITVKEFLHSIPKSLKQTVKTVCSDMYDGFVQAATEVFGSQVIVIDRYHVAKLYRAPLDRLRIKEMQRLKIELPSEKYAKLEGMMWILRTQHECLTESNKTKLSLLYKYSPKLQEAHSYALKLTHIFNTKGSRKSASAKINRWIKSVEKSNVYCFDSFIKTLEKYKSGIINYFKSRKNSGFVEGLNNKIKVVKRRCYGIFKPKSLFQRLQLDLRGFEIYGLKASN